MKMIAVRVAFAEIREACNYKLKSLCVAERLAMSVWLELTEWCDLFYPIQF